MKRKPVVFLSHSKKDKAFIQKIAGDLRNARIDCWYDDWEIPPGEPFMRKIFDEGLPESDLFFVYLSESAVTSYWVEKELDSAILLDKDKSGGFMATFIDHEATRSKLRLDLRTINAPVLNETEYFEPFYKLLSRCWEGHAKQMVAIANEKRELELVRLQRENEELKLQILQNEKNQSKHKAIKSFLEKQILTLENKELNLKDIFNELVLEINNAFPATAWDKFELAFDAKIEYEFFKSEVLDKLVFARLIELHYSSPKLPPKILLTQSGSELAIELLTEFQQNI